MYTRKFAKFNKVKGNIIMSEELTLKVNLDNAFEGKIPKEFNNITPEEWAKYAFKNNNYYVITYFKDGKAYVSVSNSFYGINYMYFTTKEGNLFNYLNIGYTKGYIDEKTDDFVWLIDDRIFLNEISLIGDIGKSLIFYPNREKDNVFLDEFIEEDGKTYNIEQYGTADLSKHWFDDPKDYLDYERLIDYQALFDSMPTLLTKKK